MELIKIDSPADLPTSVDKRQFFEVSESTFLEFQQRHGRSDIRRCNEAEVKTMREILQDDRATTDNFAFRGNGQCNKCARKFNFYDIFTTALALHGESYIKWSLLGDGKRINLVPKSMTQVVTCSVCNHRMEFDALGSHTYYQAINFGYGNGEGDGIFEVEQISDLKSLE